MEQKRQEEKEGIGWFILFIVGVGLIIQGIGDIIIAIIFSKPNVIYNTGLFNIFIGLLILITLRVFFDDL